MGSALQDIVVASLEEVPHVRVLDRSLTRDVVREQDLTLLSRASEVLPARFGRLGTQRLLITSVARLPSGYVLGLRVVEVASGETVSSQVLQLPSERKLLAECGAYVRSLWREGAGGQQSASGTVALDPTVAMMCRELDSLEARRLLGRELERAESVCRQYRHAIEAGDSAGSARLCQLAGVYLTDCLTLLQRAQDPPAGMVYIPPGWVYVAFPGGKARRFWLDGFFIDVCEYTRAQYARFLAATGRTEPLGWQEPSADTGDLPVVGVDWHDAATVARWRGMCLPTYAQWLRALRGEQQWKYPWGADWRADCCSYVRNPRHPRPEPVGSYPGGASRFGVLDGVGGAWEWLDTRYSSDYWNTAPSRNPPGPQTGAARMAAGGSYRDAPGACTCESFQRLTPGTRKDDLGFRCVLPLKAHRGETDATWESASLRGRKYRSAEE